MPENITGYRAGCSEQELLQSVNTLIAVKLFTRAQLYVAKNSTTPIVGWMGYYLHEKSPGRRRIFQ